MKYFLSDSRLSNRLTARERSKLLTGLQDIKHYIDNDTIDDDDKKYLMEANYFNRFSGVVKTLDDISIFDNKIRLQGMKRSLYNKLRDWGRGRERFICRERMNNKHIFLLLIMVLFFSFFLHIYKGKRKGIFCFF